MQKLSENILSWCANPEQGAIDQALNISKHPCLIGNVCLMPDTHQGFGMPIGGVAAFVDAVCPNMVGVDIGCGMLAVKTSLTDISTEQLKNIMGIIRENIPVGMKHRDKAVNHPIFDDPRWELTTICAQEQESARRQIGTLGGGNHFIEIQRADDGHIWFMIHSGSRNLGYKVAKHYNEIAEKLCAAFRQDEVVKNQLAFLPTTHRDGVSYLREMHLCLDFAYYNRMLMADHIKSAFTETIPSCTFFEPINIHHNYATLENHYSRNVWIHRKGATSAKENELGIIPGSQGTASYIVRGLGNRASMLSCSHGAGRKMSRTEAKTKLSVETESELMNSQGILHSIRTQDDLDEAPSAYKDIDVVMEEQKDLVEIITKLKPLAVIKG